MESKSPNTEFRGKWFSVIILIIVIGLTIGLYFVIANLPASSTTLVRHDIQDQQVESDKVTRVVDGDTIVVSVNGKSETLRLIGVDTPETHDPRKAVQCYGQAAAAYTKSLIGTHQVRLETDKQSADRDRYGRLLRYVYLDDGQLVEAEIIKNGYGFAYPNYPFDKLQEFSAYQKDAQANKRGLWGSCQPTLNANGSYTSNNAQ